MGVIINRSCFIFLVVILSFLMLLVMTFRHGNSSEEVFLHQLIFPASGQVDVEAAEILWMSCRLELTHMKEIFKSHDFCFPEEVSASTNGLNSNCQSPSKENVRKLLNVLLHPKLKQTLLVCIRKNNILLPVTGEESFGAKYLRSLYSSPDSSRRNLASEDSPKKKSSAKKQSDDDDEENDRKIIIIAVVVTAVVTFAFAALFFLCCTGIYMPARLDDEKHLLSLSMSDYSVGSSARSYGHGDSIKEDSGHGYQLYSNSSSHNRKASSVSNPSLDKPPSLGNAATKPSTESSDASIDIDTTTRSSLKPPPGIPPLKPPPGREVPLPPEPPTSNKPPAGPPPPPPPTAPPPSRSANTGPPPAGPPPPPPPRRAGAGAGAPPPPPPKGGSAPRPPPPMGGSKVPWPPFGAKSQNSAESSDPSKAKLKPFFWDKVMANPDSSMVWHQIKAGSFQFNEEMIETLFGYTPVDKNKTEHRRSASQDSVPQFIQIIDPKKSQNLAILLRALNITTEEVCDALLEGNELPAELIQTLLKMAPAQEEELKLRLFNGPITQLGPAERFLKALVDIPFAFQRLDALLFMCSLQEEVASTIESFDTLELACKELRNSQLFLKLLEAVLKTGNRMNDGTFRGGAQAFRLDTLLKLSDVKGVDGKTTLLHFVVREIIRSEGIKATRIKKESRSFSSIKTEDLLEEATESDEFYLNLGLQVVSCLSSQLENVKKAAIIDADTLTGTVAKLGHSLLKSKNFLNKDMKNMEEESEFHETLKGFVENAEADVMSLLEEEKRIMALVKSTGDYFHGNAAKDEGLRLFVIVRDFLLMIDKVCKEVRDAPKKPAPKPQKKEEPPSVPPPASQPPPPDLCQKLFPQIADRRMDHSSSSSSDDES